MWMRRRSTIAVIIPPVEEEATPALAWPSLRERERHPRSLLLLLLLLTLLGRFGGSGPIGWRTRLLLLLLLPPLHDGGEEDVWDPTSVGDVG